MKIDVQVHDALTAVDPRHWGSLAAARSVFQDLSWYCSAPPIGALRLVVAYVKGRPAAILPLFVVEGQGFYYHTPRDLFCGFREQALLERTGCSFTAVDRALAANWYPAIVSVSPYGYPGGLITGRQDGDGALGPPMAAAVERICRHEKMRLAAHFYLNESDDASWIEALSAHDVRFVIAGADCGINIQWDSLDRYFRALGARGDRQRTQHRRALATANVRWRCVRLPDDALRPEEARAAAELFALTVRNHGDAAPPVAFYRNLLTTWPV